MSWIHQMVAGGKGIDPGKLNPYRLRRPQKRERPPGPAENAAAWQVLDTFFARVR